MKPWKRTRKGAQPGSYVILDRASGDVCGDLCRLDRRTWHWMPAPGIPGAWWGFADSLSEAADKMHALWLGRNDR